MKVLHFFLLLLFTQVLFSQKISISGKVLDAKNGEPIIGAAIALLQATDSAVVTGEITDVDG